MARPRKLKGGGDAHEFTREDSAKGERARAEKIRSDRAQAQEAADEQLFAGVAKALERLERLLQSENEHVAFRAAREYLDRSLGKAGQSNQGEGGHEFARVQAIAIAKEELTIEMDRKAVGSVEKLRQLLERRAGEIATGNGTSDRILPHDLS